MTQMNAVTSVSAASTSSPQCFSQQNGENSPESGKESMVGSVESVRDRSHLFLDPGSKRTGATGLAGFGVPRRNLNAGNTQTNGSSNHSAGIINNVSLNNAISNSTANQINAAINSLTDNLSPMYHKDLLQIVNAVMSPAGRRGNYSFTRTLAQSAIGNHFAKTGLTGADLIAETPTPTKILYPKAVTQDQQEFANGFTKALEEIQQRNQFAVNNLSSPTANLLLPLLAQLTPTLANPPPIPQGQNSSPINALLNALTPTQNPSTEQFFAAFASLAGTPTGISPTTSLPVASTTAETALPTSQTTSAGTSSAFTSAITTSAPLTSQLMDNMFSNHPDLNNFMSHFNQMPPHSQHLLQPHNYHQNNGMSQVQQQIPQAINVKSEPGSAGSAYNMNGGGNGPCQPPPQMCPPSTSHHVAASQPYPSQHHSASSGSVGPVPGEEYLSEQERRKLERKRARNRMAASKCRQRKIERITQLEGEVQQERQRFSNLQASIDGLQKAINMLQTEFARHKNAGCSLEKTTYEMMNHLNSLMSANNNALGINVEM